MATQARDIHIPLSPQQAFMIVQAAGAEIPKFKLLRADPQIYRFTWHKSWGLSNPITVEAGIVQLQDGTSGLHVEANILALADPFGFLKGTLDQFEAHIMNHVRAFQTGEPVPPPPQDHRPLIVNLVIIGALVGLLLLTALFLVATTNL